MSICAEKLGHCELDPESGEPNGNCVFAKLTKKGALAQLWLMRMEGRPFYGFSIAVGLPRYGPNKVINTTQPDSPKDGGSLRKL